MRYDDPNVTTSAIVGIVGAVVLFVTIVLLQALFFRMQEGELDRKVYSQQFEELRSIDAAQVEILNSYGWVDQANGVARIPIDRAMDLVAQESARRAP